MKGKICLVTGANDGIGFEVSLGLAEKGAQVVMLCRNERKARIASEKIKAATGHEPSLLICDLGNPDEIRSSAAQFRSRFNRLDVLVHNAAVFYSQRHKTAEGIETQFAVNHLGPFLLTHLLMPELRAASPSRLVVTASSGHYGGRIRFNDLAMEQSGYDGFRAYKQTKLANVLFAAEFARRFGKENIFANSLHPGGVRTDLANKDSSGIYRLIWRLAKPFLISPKKGAETTLYLATEREAEKFEGLYFERCKPRQPDPQVRDKELARRLWEFSEQLTGIRIFGAEE